MSLLEPRNALFPRPGKSRPRATPRTGTTEERAKCLRLEPGEDLPQPPSAVHLLANSVELGRKVTTDEDRARDALKDLGPSLGRTHSAKLAMGV